MNDLLSCKLPKRIEGLTELAYNLWWSWHIEARQLFKSLDRPLWKAVGHNPVKLLYQIAPYRMVFAAQNPSFLKRYDSVMSQFKADMSSVHPWLTTECPSLSQHTIAYFSLEFAIHNSLSIYAGGLGVLAGDFCKEASDLGLPLVGLGFMYPQGYFHQHISDNGWQEEIYEQLNFNEAPIKPVLTSQGQTLTVDVPLDSRSIKVAVWQVNVGRVKLYLLDANIEENSLADRQLSARLYVGDREMRLQQEIVIGIGGVRVLRALGIEPTIWHANEGHSTFMMLERARELVESGMDFSEAANTVRASTVFTTHTPVPAGNDVFSLELMEKYFQQYWGYLKLDRDTFLNLGIEKEGDSVFNMTVLGMRMSDRRNGVSQLHGRVCRHMWHSLWPDSMEENVPVGSVTNGVHVPTWIAPQIGQIYEEHLGQDWIKNHDDPALWESIQDIPDEEIWEARRWLKNKLIHRVQDQARKRWSEDLVTPVQALAMGALLSTDALTIGFCRRFTDYKRSALILHDIDRLKNILQNELQPVQIIFAGKAHPMDERGKELIQEVYLTAKDPQVGGRIAFVENYDMHMARYLIRGVDVWLNTPRPLHEASGTSGQKAALNGVPHLSVLDGWWYEGYNGTNGWAISDDFREIDPAHQDELHANELYRLLEEKIIPLYFDRDLYGVPHGWIQMIKEAIRSNSPLFSARRMVKDYVTRMYLPCTQDNLLSLSRTSRTRRISNRDVLPAKESAMHASKPKSKPSRNANRTDTRD